MTHVSLWSLLLVFFLFAPVSCFAQTAGANMFVSIIDNIVNIFVGTWIIVAVLMLTIMGLRLVMSHDDSTLSKAKTAIGAVVVGIMMIALSNPAKNMFYQFGGTTILPTADAFTLQTLGITQWISGMTAIIGITMIVLSVLRAVSSFGDEAAYSQARTALAHAIGGMMIVALNVALKQAIFNNMPNPLVAFVMTKVIIVLGFLTLIALAIIIYAGARMVANFGNEEALTTSRSLIFRTLGGLVVVGVSFLLAEFVIFAL